MKPLACITFCFLAFALSGCASGPPKTLVDAQTISVTVGYEGELKAASDLVTVVLDGPVSIVGINGKGSSFFSNQYRELKILNYGKHVAYYVHLLPGKNEVRLYYNDGQYAAGDGFARIMHTIDSKAGDVVRIGHEFVNSGRRGGITFKTVDASKDKSIAEEHYQRVLKSGDKK
jgi:hypothetical protein